MEVLPCCLWEVHNQLTGGLLQAERAVEDKEPDEIGGADVEDNVAQYGPPHDVELTGEQHRAGDHCRDEYSGACIFGVGTKKGSCE